MREISLHRFAFGAISSLEHTALSWPEVKVQPISDLDAVQCRFKQIIDDEFVAKLQCTEDCAAKEQRRSSEDSLAK